MPRSLTFRVSLAVCVLIAIGTVFALPQGLDYSNNSSQVYESATARMSRPSGSDPSTQEVLDLMGAYANGTPLPNGWVLDEDLGNVHARLTGIVDLTTGRKQIAVVVRDDVVDLDDAKLYLNGILKFHATLQNGAIVQSGTAAIATLTLLLPVSLPYDLEIVWSSSTSGPESEHVHLQQ